MPSASDSDVLLLATRSAHKAREIREILAAGGTGRILTLNEAGIPPSPEEDDIEAFDTFTANALAKARYFADRSGLTTLADDSGIRIDALGGRPGVHSKRFAGRDDLEGESLDRANNEALLAELAATGSTDRGAHYVCVAVLASQTAPLITVGSSSGTLLEEPRGTNGFGYDPLFLVPGLGRTFAEISADEKHALSHRGRAFRALASFL